MKFVADLHIHSHYSRATSKNLDLEHLSQWAQLKGVDVVGTGDISHPGWLAEMKEKLEPAEEGLFRLKADVAKQVQEGVFSVCQKPVRFLLAGEISSIYKKGGKVRKVHNVIFAPSFESVEKIQVALEKIGNIRSDGRPILGLDSRDLLEIILEIDPQNYLIPAHIWTPWFSMLGSKSGFDSVEECFDDLTPHIFALETGLSSDPAMNWRISNLDGYTLVSNSDAHSPPKLAREANLFDTELSYPAIFETLKTGDPDSFLGTIEFFPEEGKYHMDGHRKCNICWHPQTTMKHGGKCAICGKAVTVGVMHRVEELADRPVGGQPERTHPYHSLVPLPEILSEIHGVGVNTKRVKQSYEGLLTKLGSELGILQSLSIEAIKEVGGELLAEGIRRMRCGEITPTGGYDGEYGVIKLFEAADHDAFSSQLGLFAPNKKKASGAKTSPKTKRKRVKVDEQGFTNEPFELEKDLNGSHAQPEEKPAALAKRTKSAQTQTDTDTQGSAADTSVDLLSGLNEEQQAAARCIDVPLIIVAGPGTGKTRTLTHRIAYLIREKAAPPTTILAITFTNKAAGEMKNRLIGLLGEAVADQITIKTFHAFGLMILRERGEQIGIQPGFSICNEQDRQTVLKGAYPDLGEKERNLALAEISAAKNQLMTPDSFELKALHPDDTSFIDLYRTYEATLYKNQLLDFDDLISQVVHLFDISPELLQAIHQRFRWISVDEYQDINYAQYRLLCLLVQGKSTEPANTLPPANLCVIGDPDQAIYGFRGANREYFLTFQDDFPHARRLHLSRNYRSTQMILNASTQVIAKQARDTDVDSEAVQIWSDFVDKTKLKVHQAPTDKAEAEYVVHQIEQMVGGTSYFSLDSGRVDDDSPTNRSFGDFVVLYRLNAQSRLLIEAFERSGIPYQTIGQTPFYEQKESQEILAYLWFLHNPQASLHLEQILNARKPIFKPKMMARLSTIAEEMNLSLWDVLQNFSGLSFLNKTQTKALTALVPFLSKCQNAQRTGETQSIAQRIESIRQFILAHYPPKDEEKWTTHCQRLIHRARPFEDKLSEFLALTTLQREADEYDPRADRVTLMTLHASKGLEFPVVFIVGCEERLLPYEMANRVVDLEEERRLFYVGMTRAQQQLLLIHAQKRFLFGEWMQNAQSPFVGDIETALKQLQAIERQKILKETPEMIQLTLF